MLTDREKAAVIVGMPPYEDWLQCVRLAEVWGVDPDVLLSVTQNCADELTLPKPRR